MAKRKQVRVSNDVLAVRGREMLDFRIKGYSYQAIADHFGVSASGVFGQVRKLLDEARANYSEKATELLELELTRVDRMLNAIHDVIMREDKIEKDEDPDMVIKKTKISLAAMDIADKLLDRKAKLLGFYRSNDNSTKEPLPWNDDD